MIEFLNLNKDKNIRVEFIGDRRYTTTMSPTDRQAVAGVYELSKILSAMQQIKKEQEDANLKIGFINKKKNGKRWKKLPKNKGSFGVTAFRKVIKALSEKNKSSSPKG